MAVLDLPFRLFFLVLFFLPLSLEAKTDIVDLSFSFQGNKDVSLRKNTDWDRMIEKFSLNFPHKSPQVDAQIEALLQDRYHVDKALKNMAPYIPWLLSELKKRDLPAELLVIPLIESCYEAHVSSKHGALGLWQIMPITADHMKLEPSYGFEPRLDIAVSTQAALSFLEQLHDNFKSWVLALAAYNAGPTRVRTALKKIKFRHDMDFFKLDLPEQTLQYVPKILAFAHIIKHYDYYQLTLPSKIDPLTQVVLKKEVDFTTLALALDCPVGLIRKYNYQYSFKAVPRGSSLNVFVPQSYLSSGLKHFHSKLNHYRLNPYYIVKKGDTLLKISSRFGLSVKELMSDNNLKSTFLRQGQQLKIEPIGFSLMQPVEYTVAKGDCLSKIANKFGCSVKEIQKANKIKGTTIFVGQKLIITRNS